MKRNVFAYLHTHWDREWYRNKEDFNLRFLDVFDIVLSELTNSNAPFFYMDGQVIALLDYLKYRSDKKNLIKKLIQEKKLAIGPYYVSADSYLVNFCSMLKNLDIGLKISQEFGQKDFIGYLADIFGISNSVFTALLLKGIDKAIIWRGVNPDSINNNCNFLKNNIKTHWLAQGYFNDFLHSGNISGLKNYIDKIAKYSKNNILLPIGADHLGMLKNANSIIEKVNRELDEYNIILTNPFEYFANSSFTNKTDVVEFLDNSNTYILQGVYSSRIHQKILNNKIQTRLSRIVEPLNFFLNDKYQPNIDYVYETLIKNHAHDGIYGCSTDEVHKAVESRFNKCLSATDSIIKNIIANYKNKNNIKGKIKDKIGVFNLSNSNCSIFKVKTPYRINNSQIISKEKAFPDEILYDIYKVPVTEEITTIYTSLVQTESSEPFSYSIKNIIKPKKQTKVTENTLENAFIKLYIKNKKIFIYDKNSNKEIEIYLSDIKDEGDSYNFAPIGEYLYPEILKTKVLYDGIIESSLIVIYKDVKLKISLNNDSEYISFEAVVKNKKKNHKLQINFNLNNAITETISDDAIGIVKRKINPDYLLKDNMPAIRPYELKTNCYPMQNFVTADGISILTKGLNEYEVHKNTLKLCLLRATGTISNPKNQARAIPAGPDIKCEDLQYLNQEIKLNFALLFNDHFGAFKNLDLFNEIYATVHGDFKEELHKKYINPERNTYIYGINSNNIIGYNIKNNKIIYSGYSKN